MTDFINSFFTKNKTSLIFFLIFGCVCGAFFRYEFAWWDAVNYHYYNPWAFLNNRLNTDIVPAVANTFFSPFIDFPYYFLVNAFDNHPVLFCAIMAVPYGLLLFFAYKITSLFFPSDTTQGRIRIGLALLLCVCSETVFFQICSCSHEHLMSLMILAAFYPLLKSFFNKTFEMKTFMVSGFVLGAAAGLKLSYAPYAAATGLTLIFFYKRLDNPVGNIVAFTLCGTAGFLIAYGYWGWILWKNYGNPFFPFFNSIFKSPYWTGADYKDIRYFDKPWITVLFYPFFLFWNLGRHLPLQHWFVLSNFRLVVGGIFFFRAAADILKAGKNGRKEHKDALLHLLMFWMAVVYIIWLCLFRVYRYMIPFELLLSIVLIRFIFAKREITSDDKRMYGLLFFVAFMMSSMFSNYGRYYVWPVDRQLIPTKPAALSRDTLLIVKKIPGAIFVPFLAKDETVRAVIDPDLRKVYNGSNFYATGRFAEKRDKLIREHKKQNKPVVYLSGKDPCYLRSELIVFGARFTLCRPTDSFYYKPSVPINIWLDKTEFFIQNKEKFERNYRYVGSSGTVTR